jgi:hypothetical protein
VEVGLDLVDDHRRAVEVSDLSLARLDAGQIGDSLIERGQRGRQRDLPVRADQQRLRTAQIGNARLAQLPPTAGELGADVVVLKALAAANPDLEAGALAVDERTLAFRGRRDRL